MATVTEVKSTTLSGLNHIDALLGNLPNWNYLTSGGNNLYYTFSVAGGLETGNSAILSAPQAFSAAQQAATRTALNYLAQITGIKFTETNDTGLAQIHMANANINGSNTTGLDSSRYSYSYDGNNNVTKFTAATYVYLDNAEWAGMNANLTPGTQGYETLLHELGHALGLKHSFDGAIRLPTATDNTAYTLMSYTHAGGVHSTFGEYDLAALKWLYGGDGLGGALGVNSIGGGRYITGTSQADTLTGTTANDMLEGGAGNDILDGGAGIDTAFYSGARSAYAVTQTGASAWQVSGLEGTDTLKNIEQLRFSDGTVAIGSSTPITPTTPTTPTTPLVDTIAPVRPTLVFTKDGWAAASGNHPTFSGVAEAGAKVEIFNGSTSLGVGKAAANGSWSITPVALANGNYHVTARATDAAGNVSEASLAKDFAVSSVRNITGTAGSDRLVATSGINYIDGGAGTDTVVYSGVRANYLVEKTAYGYKVTDRVGNGGSDLLVRDERIQFKDVTVTLDNTGIAQANSANVVSFNQVSDLDVQLIGSHKHGGLHLHDLA
ncbi:Ig-like domain-containing protein [Massilia sp. YIM B04103]|uniref:Ig-like domain-containing protein n=1 Tax=Massilia sp. YIM B04103 TaxID=2963106 RepID=UPI00210AA3A4|nr:Ig-like domain-containing protein [Massilia sp. YIM B04103]